MHDFIILLLVEFKLNVLILGGRGEILARVRVGGGAGWKETSWGESWGEGLSGRGWREMLVPPPLCLKLCINHFSCVFMNWCRMLWTNIYSESLNL